MTSATYFVSGMTCEHCVRAVTDELDALPGVSAVRVTLVPGGESAVSVTSEAVLPLAQVEAALGEAGDYRMTAVRRSEAGPRLHPRTR